MPRLAERLAGPLSTTKRASTRAASSSGMPQRFQMLGSVFQRKTSEKDPAMAIRRAETEASKTRQEQITQANVTMLGDISMIMQDNNDLLQQIVDEVKKLELGGSQQDEQDSGFDIDLDRRRRRGRAQKRGRATQSARRAPVAQPQQRPPATPRRPMAQAGRQMTRGAIRQRIGTRIRQTIADRVTTKIPGLGLLFTLFFAGQRAAAGDLVGAGLEIASGAAAAAGPLTFGFGTAVSIGLDIASLARDVYGDVYGVDIESDPERDERLGVLTAAIREEVEEMISSSPRPQAPPFTSETREQLILLYRQAQQDENLRAIIGEDVMAGLVPLLRIDPTRPGPMNERVREGMQRTLNQLQQRVTRTRAAPVSDAETRTAAADQQQDTRSMEDLLQLIRGAEFDEVKFEADKVRFEGDVKFGEADQAMAMATPVSNPIGPAAAAEAAATLTPQMPAAAPAAAALVSEGTEMASADQQQIRSSGQQIVVPVPMSADAMQQQQAPIRLGQQGRGEVPLNIRLEKQVA